MQTRSFLGIVITAPATRGRRCRPI
jgi:hypothetical protein